MFHSSTGLTNEELVLRIQRGEDVNDNLQQLYNQNTGLIYKKYVRQYLTEPEEYDPLKEDLMQEAFLGLWEATKRYKLEAGCKFMSYAGFWIRQRISRYCKSNGNLKRIPDHMLQRISSYHKYLREYRTDHDRYPSNKEICSALSLSEKQLLELQRIISETDTISLDAAIPGTELTVKDTIADDKVHEDQLLHELDQETDRKILWKIVDDLDYPKSGIIIGYYKDRKTLKQLADQYGLSHSRIQQIIKDALKILAKKEELRQLAMEKDFYYSDVYNGSLSAFKKDRSSIVEKVAIRILEKEDQKNKLMKELAEMKLAYQRGEI